MNSLLSANHNIRSYIGKRSGELIDALQLPDNPQVLFSEIQPDHQYVLHHGNAVCKLKYEANCRIWDNKPAWIVSQPTKYQYTGSPGAYILWINNTVSLLPEFTFESLYTLFP